ncbi:MAG TPA: adenosylmethionine decarboxylase [Saprospirales bacterium]|nr:adenosylmethionine decarboxylase [Saprospirales bacterium]
MTYQPGLHRLLSLNTPREDLLRDMNAWLTFIRPLLPANGLQVVGEAAHQFEGAGFTVAICLAESHICIHTWPEFGFLTLDIYLCNYSNRNEEKVRALSNQNVVYFGAEITQQQELFR